METSIGAVVNNRLLHEQVLYASKTIQKQKEKKKNQKQEWLLAF